MIFLGLTREASDQRSTEHNVRDLTAKFRDNVFELLPCRAAAHSLKDTVACMLDRKVKIIADLLFFFHDLDQLIVDLLRITVENTDPADSFDLTELLKQDVECFFAVEICTVNGGLLSYKDQLLDSLRCHVFCLCKKSFFRNTSESATKGRDDAVGAVLVTALCDLEITKVAARCQHTSAGVLRKFIDITELLENISCLCFV